jgi:hypothetical protein
VKTIADISDDRRITKRDIAAMNHLLDTYWFAVPRKRFSENQKQFVNLVLSAETLYSKNKKYPTVGEARAENQRNIEHREKLDRDYFESRRVKA